MPPTLNEKISKRMFMTDIITKESLLLMNLKVVCGAKSGDRGGRRG